MSIYEIAKQFGLRVKEVQTNVYEVIDSNTFVNYKGLQYSIGRCSMVTSDSCESSINGDGIARTFRKIYYIFIYGVSDNVIAHYEKYAKDTYNNDVLYSAYSGEQDSYSATHIDTIYSKEELGIDF